ncbi:AAA family ATPase [Marinobacter sp. CA1]|uniref:AAA family ATPase n=1 Tax=Marinobacter sp. CA1 TaxID=2817656 RepID=UPI001D08E9AF|nr:AAA family ATPase [Marinobacter sp. CA1]UDL07153.1 AAA family ATPase [Marinobacter sp. CA1]
MKLINVITKETFDVSDDAAERWINSCTPWEPFQASSSQSTYERNEGEAPETVSEVDETPSTTPLLQNILDWSQDLPDWIRDALRRLFAQESILSDQDYQELYALMKAENGLLDQTELSPDPLSKDHLPTTLAPESSVIVKSMGGLSHVNKISPDQELIFEPSGITVIFGANGSGKSGYARVLKRACRARDQTESIHPDASDSEAALKEPTGRFEIELEGSPQTLDWSRDQVSPEPLSTISVFDTRCARSILTDEHDVAYLPYGLDIIESLANKVIPRIKHLLDEEIEKLNVDTSPFVHLRGATQAGRMVSELGPNTSEEDITELSTLSEEENERLKELNDVLANVDPLVKAKELTLSKERLKNLADDLDDPLKWVSDAAVRKLAKLTNDKISADKAVNDAAEALRAGEDLIPGTGSEAWKALFYAAKRFAVEEVYKETGFPSAEAYEACPLCQQNLTEEANSRLIRFAKYVESDVSVQANKNQQALSDAVNKIESAKLHVGMTINLADEISMLDANLPFQIREFETSVQNRRESMLRAVTSNDWLNVSPLHASPRTDIRSLAAKQLQLARNFIRASDPKKKRRLEEERAELSARLELSKVLAPLLTVLRNIKQKAALQECQRTLNTRPISAKSKELASHAVNEELRAALEEELGALGVDHIRTVLTSRTLKGQMLHRLILDVPTETRIDEILSEGEQRAIALASFFAELATANHKGGIIFDDPVSSLDHWRRIRVAKRLVEEASKRQVIVFTHDTSFLGQLRDEIDQSATSYRLMYLERDRDSVGYVREGLPWGHQGYKARIESLEIGQQDLAHQWSPYPSEALIRELRILYSELRATVERVIQDVIFNGVVARYRDWVKVNKLKGVVGFSMPEYEAIDRIHKRCCDVVEAHDPSADRGISLPSATDLGTDIQELKRLIVDIKERRRDN